VVIFFAELASEKPGNSGQCRHKSRLGHKGHDRCDGRERANGAVFRSDGDFGSFEKSCRIRVVGIFRPAGSQRFGLNNGPGTRRECGPSQDDNRRAVRFVSHLQGNGTVAAGLCSRGFEKKGRRRRRHLCRRCRKEQGDYDTGGRFRMSIRQKNGTFYDGMLPTFF